MEPRYIAGEISNSTRRSSHLRGKLPCYLQNFLLEKFNPLESRGTVSEVMKI